jgi:hypothetical protein
MKTTTDDIQTLLLAHLPAGKIITIRMELLLAHCVTITSHSIITILLYSVKLHDVYCHVIEASLYRGLGAPSQLPQARYMGLIFGLVIKLDPTVWRELMCFRLLAVAAWELLHFDGIWRASVQ